MIRFTIPGRMIGKQRPRASKDGHFYTPKETREHEGYLKHQFADGMAGRAPLNCPVVVTCEIYSVAPKSVQNTRAKRAALAAGLLYPTSKPDIDNIVKAICDAMNKVVLTDDVKIVEMRVRKRYADREYAVITVDEEINPGEDPFA